MDLLTAEDFELIDACRRSASRTRECYNGDYCDSRTLLRKWADAKDRFLGKIFKDQLIIEKEFSREMSEEELRNRFSCYFFDDFKVRNFHNQFLNKAWYMYPGVYSEIASLFNPDALAANEQLVDTFEIEYQGRKIKFQKGSKVIRSLRRLIPVLGLEEDDFTYLVNRHSQMLNDKTVRGTLCYSIHPLDYMTMSDNAENWESCMSWADDGCYSLGTTEMMNSDCVVVVYLKSDSRNYHFYEGGEWNSKKWRILMIVSPEVVASIKAYPYRNDTMAGVAMKDLIEMTGLEYSMIVDMKYDEGDCAEVYIPEREGKCKEKLEVRFRTEYMYNDFGCVTSHLIAIGKEYWEDESLRIEYSGEAQCMWCGGSYDLSEESIICENCDRRIFCECCGDPIHEDNSCELDGYRYCEYCFNEHARESYIHPGEYFWDDDSIYVYVIRNDVDFSSQINDSFPVSRSELNDYRFIELCGHAEEIPYRSDAYGCAYTRYLWTVDVDNVDEDFLCKVLG